MWRGHVDAASDSLIMSCSIIASDRHNSADSQGRFVLLSACIRCRIFSEVATPYTLATGAVPSTTCPKILVKVLAYSATDK